MSSRPSAPKHLRHSPLGLPGLLWASAPLAAVLLAAAPASAQEPPSNCPPGSWFCAEAQEKPAPKAAAPAAASKGEKGDKAELEPLPPAESLPPPPPPVVVYRPGPPPPPPVVVYAPPPPVRPPPPYYYYRPRPPRSVFAERSEWGINLRGEGAVKGSGSASSETMAGVGFGLRYKPVPAFGLEAGFDFLGGRDYQNFHRNETEFTVNAMVFVNPRSRVQLYFLAGLGGSWAHVASDQGYYAPSGNYGGPYGYGDANYTYFGGQAGGGLEFRIARHFAMNIDVRGFIRSRTDSAAANSPEFVDPGTGRTTNTSDGCLVNAGMTFYF
jgi:hypothetical protein